MDKHKAIKNNYNFEVFKDYKCDGQLVMKFDDTGVKIREEEKENLEHKSVDNYTTFL